MKTYNYCKLRLASVIGFLAAGLAAHAQFVPFPLTSGSYTYDMIVESNFNFAPMPDTVTVTMDGGPISTGTGGNTWYEQGLDLAAPTTGLPHAGATFASITQPDHSYQMAPSYLTNNVVFIGVYDTNYAGQPPGYVSGGFNLVTPQAYTALSVLTSAGNGPVGLVVNVLHADGSTDSGIGQIDSPDWFNAASSSSNYAPAAVLAYVANGRATPAGTLNNVNGGNVCEVWSVDFPLANSTRPVTNINFEYFSGGRCCVFGISGSTAAGGTGPFTPIAVTGYNADAIIEAPSYRPYNATMDNGTNIATGGGNTWFETGYAPSGPIAGPAPITRLTNGIPAHASTFTSPAPYSRQYTMAPSYQAANAIFIDTNIQSATITPATPSAEAALSFLVSGANIGGGVMSNLCIVQHADGTSETNFVLGYDWFNATQPAAWVANGRLGFTTTAALGQPNNIGNPTSSGNFPRLFESEISLADTTSPVTSISLQYYNPSNTYGTGWRTEILAVSGSQKGVPVLIGSSTAAQNIYAGSNAYFNATLTFGDRPAYQWQFVSLSGATNNLSNGGNISGVNSPTLVISNATAANLGYYQVVITNAINTNISAAAPLTFLTSTATNLTSPKDVISDFENTGGSPAGQTVAETIDGTLAPYVDSGPTGLGSPWNNSGTGFSITPNVGSSIATALRIYTSGNPTNNDPADVQLEGSNDGGNSYAQILPQTTLALPSARNAMTGAINASNEVLQEVDFANTSAYSSYRVTFHNLKDNTTTNGLSVAEVQILGGVAPLPPGILTEPNPLVYGFTGGNITFQVTPNGPAPFTYQWLFNGNPISRATNSSLVLSNVQPAAVGAYSVTVSNAYGSVTSSNGVIASLLPSNKFINAVLALNPLSFWPLQETNGTTAYDYVGVNDGTYNGGFTLGEPGVNLSSFGSGSFSVLFDGSSGYVNIPGPGNLVIDAPMTAMCWFQGLNPNGGFHTIFGRSDVSWRFDYDGTGNPHWAAFGGNDATSTTSIYDGRWHLLVGVYAAATPTTGTNYLYVDGVQVASAAEPTAPGPDTDATDTWIGGTEQYTTTRLVNGYIADCVVISNAISASQVSNLFASAGASPPTVTIATNIFYGDENATATFTPTITGGVPPFHEQWYEIDGTGATNIVTGQTNLTLTLTNIGAGANSAQLNNNIQYFVVVSNAFGSATSAPATLNVYSSSPVILVDVAQNVPAPVGFPLTLSVEAVGSAPLSYQWTSNGVAIAGATNAAYSFATPSGTNMYVVTISNSVGTTTSSTATVTSIPVPTPVGFFGNGSNWTVNGLASAKIADGVFYATDGNGSEAVTAWYNNPVFIDGFTATFTYQDVGGSPGNNADGSAFVLQEAGPTALGAGGGALALNTIIPSAEWEINLYQPNGIGIIYHTNGVTGGYQPTGNVNVSSGDPINFTITYTPGGAVSETLVDTTTEASYTTNFTVGDITSLLGSTEAYVGFTSGDGGVSSVQTISNFNFQFGVKPSLTIAKEAGSVVITWPSSTSTNVVLQSSSTVIGPWANVTTTPTQVNGNYQIMVPTTGSAEFYRLAQ